MHSSHDVFSPESLTHPGIRAVLGKAAQDDANMERLLAQALRAPATVGALHAVARERLDRSPRPDHSALAEPSFPLAALEALDAFQMPEAGPGGGGVTSWSGCFSAS